MKLKSCVVPGLVLGLCPANESRRHFVTTSLTGWVQTWCDYYIALFRFTHLKAGSLKLKMPACEIYTFLPWNKPAVWNYVICWPRVSSLRHYSRGHDQWKDQIHTWTPGTERGRGRGLKHRREHAHIHTKIHTHVYAYTHKRTRTHTCINGCVRSLHLNSTRNNF